MSTITLKILDPKEEPLIRYFLSKLNGVEIVDSTTEKILNSEYLLDVLEKSKEQVLKEGGVSYNKLNEELDKKYGKI